MAPYRFGISTLAVAPRNRHLSASLANMSKLEQVLILDPPTDLRFKGKGIAHCHEMTATE